MEVLYIATAILFLIFPEASAEASSIACTALKNVVIKSLFPMMVLSRLISHARITARITGRLAKSPLWKKLNLSDTLLPAVLTGFLSGLPSASREINILQREGVITEDEGRKALSLASLPSPAFVILVASETVGKGIFRYLALVVTAYCVTLLYPSTKSRGAPASAKMTFTQALSSSVNSALLVSGNIVFFCALSCLASALLPRIRQASALFFEMGCGVIFARGNSLLIATALGWCGLSALCQIRAEAPNTDLAPYIVTRIASCVVLLLFEFLQ